MGSRVEELIETFGFLKKQPETDGECTEMIELLKIRENENIAKQAANWFHQKWGIPLEAYQESICDCLKNKNVCAVYVDEDYRCQGIAGKLLQYVCDDMKEQGIDTLYLVTDHTPFYEKYGWEFLCMVQGDGEPDMTRMYIHHIS